MEGVRSKDSKQDMGRKCQHNGLHRAVRGAVAAQQTMEGRRKGPTHGQWRAGRVAGQWQEADHVVQVRGEVVAQWINHMGRQEEQWQLNGPWRARGRGQGHTHGQQRAGRSRVGAAS